MGRLESQRRMVAWRTIIVCYSAHGESGGVSGGGEGGKKISGLRLPQRRHGLNFEARKGRNKKRKVRYKIAAAIINDGTGF